MVGDFGWEHEGTKSGVGTVKQYNFTQRIVFFRNCACCSSWNLSET